MKKHTTAALLTLLFVVLFSHNCLAGEGSQDSRFVDNGDNTIIDRKTGLMWPTEDNGIDTNWDEAKSFCETFSGGGHTDWRMPTLSELTSIFDTNSKKRYQSIDQITLSGCCPWSSESRRKRARTIFFIGGETNTFSKKSSTGFRALPVRKAP